MKYTGTLLLLILLFTSVDLHPQEIVGLWMVDKVEVGDETMTPVSRWMRFSENNKHEAGNGWLKHSEGTYAFDKKKNTLSVETKNQPTDPYGPFSVDFEKDKMFWSRVEDGANVKVVLIQIEEIPSSPANEMLGEWRISADDDDPVYGGAETLFLRWDNIFVLTTSNGEKKNGRVQIPWS